MGMFQWSSDLSVGIAEIDQQHKKLIDMIRNLNDAIENGKGRDALYDVIRGLISYTKIHFGTEELYFDEYEYEDRETHKDKHKEFIKQIVHFRDEYLAGKVDLPTELLNFLDVWLEEHIKGTDHKYSAFLISKGLQ